MRMSLGCKFKCLRKWKLWFTLLKCSIYEKAKISIFFPLLQVWGITGVKQWECLLAASLNLLTFKFLSSSPALFTVQSILVYTYMSYRCMMLLDPHYKKILTNRPPGSRFNFTQDWDRPGRDGLFIPCATQDPTWPPWTHGILKWVCPSPSLAIFCQKS